MRGFKYVASALIATLSTPVLADSLVEAVPTAWRLQNYTGGQVTAWYTGSTCPQGQVAMAGTADENNRFWSTIMSGKLTGKIVGVFYNPSTCIVTSFYLREQ